MSHLTDEQIRRIAREEVTLHEIRFTLSGAVIALCGCLGWLVATGRF